MTFSYDAIIFDFDGVLVESVDVKTRAFMELYRPYGEAIIQEVAAYHLAHGGVSRYEKFRYFHRVLLGQMLGEETEHSLASRFSTLVEDAVIAAPWVSGARQFVTAYHEQLPLHIASATPTEELLRIVRCRGMEGFFRSVMGAPEKKGEIIGRITAEHAYSPQRVLMLGDALADLEGARDAGVLFLGRVPKGARSPFPETIKTIDDLEYLAECIRE